jgi:nucleotide-binding universal stress UspA family protein
MPAPDKLEMAGMKSILVAIDFSDTTVMVIDVARQLAKALNAEIHLVHVRQFRAAAAPGSLEYNLAGMAELAPMTGVPMAGFEPIPVVESEDEKSNLVRLQTAIAQEGVKVTIHEPTGEVAEEILSQANAINADLILMGTHGHGAVYNLIVGSVTKGVLKRSTRPVLVVPGPRR